MKNVIESQKTVRVITCPNCGRTWIPMIDYPKFCQFCHAVLKYEKETRPELAGTDRVAAPRRNLHEPYRKIQ